MQRGHSRAGRFALAAVAIVATSVVADFAFNESEPALAAYCGDATDSFCAFGLPAGDQQTYCYVTEVPITFTLTSQSTAPQPSSAQVSGTYTYPGGGTGNWRMNIVGPIATTTQSPYHTGPSWGLNNAGNPYAVFYGDLGKTNLFLTPTNSPASAELVQLRPDADADYLNGAREAFANHTNHWTFDRTYGQYRLEDPSNQTTRNNGIYAESVLLYQRSTLDNRIIDYVVTGDSPSLWVQNHGGSAYEGWSQSAIAKYTSCLTVTQTGTYVDSNNNGYPDPGDNVKFTYVLTNPGSAALSGINLSDTGVTMSTSNVSVAGGASVTVTGMYPLTAADILNGSVTRNATATGKDLFGNTLTDLADSPTVSTNIDPEGDGEPDDPTTVLLPPPPVDLGVKKTDDVDPVREGDTVTYTIIVYNNGPGTVKADDVFAVYDDLPPGLIDPQYAAPAPAQWDPATGEITGVDLAPGDQIELTVTAIAATSGVTVDNRVTVKSPVADSDESNNTAVESTTILPKADLKITKTASPSPVVAGTEITWTITVGNGGPNDATNVIIDDPLPAEVTSPTVTGCTFSGTSCNIGTVPAGGSKTITITALVSEDTPAGTEIKNSASVKSDAEDPDPSNDSSTSVTPVEVESDVVLVKSSTPNPYVPGDPITYTFTIHNSGPSTATDVVLKDTFPAGLTGMTADNGACTISGPDMSCELGKLGVGDEITVTVTAQTDPGLVDPIVNEAFVDVSSNDPNPDNNLSVDTNGPKPLADLRVVKTDLADPVLAGDSIVYQVSVTNQGPSVATAVELYDDFSPSGIGLALAGEPSITSGSGNCSTSVCTFAEIGVGETVVVEYTIDVPEDVESGTTVTNTAKVGSAVPDPNDADNYTEETTDIKTQADLSITKTGDSAPVAGQNYTYVLTIANAGPSYAGTTIVQDELPAGVTFVAAGSSPTCSASGASVTCDVPALSAGDQTELTIEVAVDPAFTGTLVNTAKVDPANNADDPDLSNNTATHTGVASAEANVGVSKSVSQTSAAAGTSLEWILVVTNNGPSTATDVAVFDSMPAGVTVTSVTSDFSPSTCADLASCSFAQMAPGEVATITIVGDIDPAVADGTELLNTVSVKPGSNDPDLTNNDAEVATVVKSVADISLVKTADPTSFTPGSPLSFTISATNLGPSTALGATIVDDLPANFIYTGYTVTSGSGSCNLSGTTITCTDDELTPNEVFTVVIEGDTDPGGLAAMTNTAKMADPDKYSDPESGNDVSTVNVGSIPDADLGISKTPVGSVSTPGATKEWTVTVTNAGPTNASGVIVTDTLPAGAIFVSATPASGTGTCTHDGSASGGVITCDLGEVPTNGVVAINVTTKLDPSIADGATLTNAAEVTSDIADSNPDNNAASATITATRIADVSITKIDDPDPVVAGQDVTWKITVSNAGPSDADGVVMTDTVPEGFTIRSVSPAACEITGNDVSCPLGAVSPNTPVEVTIVATASAAYVSDGLANPVTNSASVTADHDADSANNQASTTTLVVERSDVSIAKSGPAEVKVGDTITWTIDVANAGPSVADDVVVTDVIPVGINVDPTGVVGTGCALTGSDLRCDLGTLAAGATSQIVVTGTVPADYFSTANPATIFNNASISSSSTETDITNNQAAVDTVITEDADLAVTKTADPAEVLAGEQITWTVTVTNNGPADAREAKLVDLVPVGVTVVSATADNGGTCDSAPTCLLGTVPLGDTVTVTIVADVPTDQLDGDLTNSVTVSALTPDPVPANDSASVTSTVATQADVVVSKIGPSSVTPGGPISYTIVVTNEGPSDAVGVDIYDDLPAGLLNPTISSADGTCSGPDSCFIDLLPAGETATFTLDATVDPSLTDATITNGAGGLAATNDPNPDNNDVFATSNLSALADVTVTKVGDVNPVVAGTNLTWTITAANNGPSTARDVFISDTLPPGVQLVSAPECDGTTTLDCLVGDLAPGDTYTVTITVAVDASYYDDGNTNPLTNTATVTTSTSETDADNNTATETTTVGAVAGVSVGKSHFDFSVNAGERSTWLVTVLNTGPSTAQDVVMTDAVPPGTTFVSATPDAAFGGSQTCSEAGGVITCDLGSIPVNELVDITIELDLDPDYVSAGRADPISNSASATSSTEDPTLADNTGVDTLDVQASADLRTTKTAPAEVDAGDQITWEVTVTNDGPSVAQDVTIDDPAPAGVIIDSTSPAGLCDDFVTCQIGDLAPGESSTVTINATVESTWLIQDFPQPLSNAANAFSSVTADPDRTNDTGYADTVISESAGLTVTKSDTPDPVVAGEQLTWVIAVTNDGPSVARLVAIDDPIPAGVTVTSVAASTGDGCTFDVSCTLDTVAVGATETITIVGTVDPSITATTNTIDNVATVSTPTNPDQELPAASETTVENRADLVIDKTDGGASITAGEAISWSIAVSNNGPSDAPNTTVTDTLPAGLDLSTVTVAVNPASAGNCDVTALPALSCDLGTLVAGGEATISIVAGVDSTYLADGNPQPMANTATVSSGATEIDPSNNSSTEQTPIVVEADLTLSKTGPAEVGAGETIEWTIDVGNLGPSAADTVVISDVIPAGIVVDSAGPGCAIDGQAITCNLAQLGVGDTHTVTVVGTVPADYVASGQPLAVTNGAQVTSDVADPDQTNNTSAVPTTIGAAVDLKLTKSVEPAEVTAGSAATWTVTVTNGGPSLATDVVVSDPLPAGFTATAIEVDNGGTCDAAATCLLGSVPPGASVVMTIAGTVDADFFTNGGATPIDNTADVTSTETDTNPDDNSATASLAVAASADLVTTKTGADTVVPGTTTDYLITVTNSGPSDAQAVTVTDSLPADLVDVTLTPSQGTCTDGVCELGTIPADGVVTIAVAGTVDPDSTAATLTNSAVAASPTDPDDSNNEASVTADVVPSADVEIDKVESADPIIAGESLSWTITATNHGPSTARSVLISDALPPGVTLVDAVGCDGTTSLSCDAGDIAVDASVSFTVNVTVDANYYTAGNTSPLANTATHTAATADPEPINDEHTELTTIAALAGVSVGKSADVANTSAGSQINWTITAYNAGPSDAANVVVTDPIPPGLTVTAASFAGENCTIAADIVCNLGTLAVGQSVAIDVTSTVDSAYVVDSLPDPLENLANVSSDTEDPVPDDNTGGDQVSVTAADDLVVAKTGSDTTYAGGPISWTVTVTNDGPSVAQDVVVTDAVPAGVTGVSVTVDPDTLGSCDTTVSCQFPTLAPGASVTITIDGTVPASWFTDGGGASIVNTVDASSAADTDVTNNTASATTAITESAELVIAKTATPDPVVAGQDITWTVTVTNNGPSAARDLAISDPAPAGVTITAATLDGGACTFDVTCDLAALPVGATATVTITGALDASWFSDGRGTSLTNNAIATTATNPDQEVTAEVASGVTATADVSIVKTDLADPVVAGGQIGWVLTAANAGPSDAAATVVTDTLPDGLDLATVTVTPATANCDLANLPTIRCELGTMAAGTSTAITITATLTSAYLTDGGANPINNGANIAIDPAIVDPNPDNNADLEATEVLPLADVSVVKSVEPTTANAGETVTFTMLVSNAGPSTATAVAVADTIPDGISIVSATTDVADAAPCPTTGQSVVCPIGNLAVGAQAVVTIVGTVDSAYVADGLANPAVNTARVTATSPDTVGANDTNSADVVIVDAADLAITKTASAAEVTAGTALDWTITVTNSGPSVARSVSVSDVIPSGYTPASVTADNGGACAASGCQLGDMAVGDTVTITIAGSTDPAYDLGSMTNAATVDSDTEDPDTTDNSASATATVSPNADLAITKIGPSEYTPGETVTYQIVVDNKGPSTATDVAVREQYPSGFNVDTITPSQGTCDAILSCELGTIEPNGQVTIHLVGTADPGVFEDYLNAVEVQAAQPDSDTGNNTAEVVSTANALADVRIAKDDVDDLVLAGEQLTWTLTATNDGPSAARSVSIADTLPPGTTLVSTSVTCDGATTLNCPVGDLAPGASATVTVVATVDSDYYPAGNVTPLVNQATATSATPDPATGNNAATDTTTIAANAGLSIAKDANISQVTSGEQVTWTLTVFNAGPSTGENVTVTDPLPDGVTFASAQASNGGTCTDSGAEVACDLGNLAVGTTVTIDVTATVASDYVSASLAQPLLNSAVVSGDTEDPFLGDNTGVDQIAVVETADLNLTKTGPADVDAGSTIDWSITVVNNGPSVARSVVVDDVAPAGVTINDVTSTGATASCTPIVRCELGDLDPGAELTINITGVVDSTWIADGRGPSLTNTATVGAATPDANVDDNSDDTITAVGESAGLIAVKTASTDPAIAGEAVQWTIEVTNNGPSAARDVIVDDPAPAGTTISAVAPVAGCDFAARCSIDLLDAGETATITIDTTLDSTWLSDGRGELLTNTATVSSITNGGEKLTVEGDVDVDDRADVSVTKTVDQALVKAGESLQWTVTVRNDGPSSALSTVLTDTIPAGVSAVSATPPTGATCDTANLPTLTCDLGDLGEGASVAIPINATVDPSYFVDGNATPLSNQVGVASSTDDPSPSNNTAAVDTQIANAAGVAIGKSAISTEVTAGETAAWTIEVTNAGPGYAEAVAITDQIPNGVTVAADGALPSAGTCTVDAGVLACALGSIAPGATVLVSVSGSVSNRYLLDIGDTLTNTATVTTTSDDDPADNTSSSAVRVVDQADLAIAKTVAVPDTTDGTGPAVAGRPITWTLTITNAGPSTARSVEIVDAVPAGTSVDSVLATGASCAPVAAGASTLTCTLAELAPNAEPVTITINGIVDADYLDAVGSGPIDNTASVTSATPDPTPASAAASMPVVDSADLVVAKVANADSIVAGESLSWTVTVTNNGPSIAREVVVDDIAPSGVTFTDVTVDLAGATCTVAASCDLGSIPPGTSAKIIVTGTVDPDLGAGAEITNSASVTSATPDPAATIDPVVVTPVTTSADLSITKRDAADPVIAGTTVYWTLSVANNGPSAATNVVVTDQLPDGVNLVSIAGDGASSCDATSCTFDLVEVGGVRVVTVVGAVGDSYLSSGGPNPLVNGATVSATDPDPNPDDNTTAHDTTIVAESGLSITKTADLDTAVAGGPLSWTITVTNPGPSVATDVNVTDSVPTGVVVDKITAPAGANCTDLTDCQLGELGVGAVATIVVDATVDSSAVVDGLSELVNSATVSSASEDSDPSDNTAAATTPLTASADLALVKAANGDTGAGGVVTWTLTVTNDGPSVADAVTVTDLLPDGLTLSSVTADDDAVTCTDEIVCSLGQMEPGAAVVITVETATPVDPTTSEFVNSAKVASPTPDPDTSNNGSSATATALGAQLGLAKRVVGTPQLASDGSFEVVYELAVENTGSAALSAAQINDDLASQFGDSASFEVVAVTSDDLTVNPDYDGDADTSLLAGTDLLAPGASATVELTVKIVPAANPAELDNAAVASASPATGVIVSDQSVDGSDVDPDGDGDPANNTTPTPVTLEWAPSIGAAKELDTAVVREEDGSFTVVFDIDVYNFGNVDLANLQIDDDLTETYGEATSFSVLGLTSPDLTVNPDFDGAADTRLLAGTDTLPVGKGGTLLLTTSVVAADPDQKFSNIANASSVDPVGAAVEDLSSAGSFGCDGDSSCEVPVIKPPTTPPTKPTDPTSPTTPPPSGGNGGVVVLPPTPGGNGGTEVKLPGTGGSPARTIGFGAATLGAGCLLVVAARRRRRATA